MASDRALRIALVGTGRRGALHLATIARMTDRFELVGVCGAGETRRLEAARQYGVPAFATPMELIDRSRPDVVVVAVPQEAHHIVTAIAAGRGCHVLCETPIATTRQMADLMIEACRKAGVVLEAAEQVWRWPAERLKRLVVDTGHIGSVTQVHLWYFTGSYHGMNAMRRFIEAAPTRALGHSRPFSVAPYIDLDGNQQRRQTWELGMLEFTDGSLAVYQWPVGGDMGNHWEAVGTRGTIPGNEVVLFGEPQGIMSRTKRRIAIEPLIERTPTGEETLAAVRLAPGEGTPAVEWPNPHARYGGTAADDIARLDLYAGMHDAVTSGRRTASSDGWPTMPDSDGTFYGAENARADQELLIAIRESAMRGGEWLPMPLASPTAIEDQLHEEFEATYGKPYTADPEELIQHFFSRGGLQQTVHERRVSATAGNLAARGG